MAWLMSYCMTKPTIFTLYNAKTQISYDILQSMPKQGNSVGCGSLVRKMSTLHASEPVLDLVWRLGHEIVALAIVALPLFKNSSYQIVAKERALNTGLSTVGSVSSLAFGSWQTKVRHIL